MCVSLGTVYCADAQDKNDFNPIQTGVNSLNIAPDARGSSMGDLGAATDPDANSQFWNPSKYAFAYSNAALSISYTPWLRSLVDDIFLANVAGYWKIGTGDNQAASASLRYFSLGEVTTGSEAVGSAQTLNPYEMSFDIGYSRKLSENTPWVLCSGTFIPTSDFPIRTLVTTLPAHRHSRLTYQAITQPILSYAEMNASGRGGGISPT